MSSQCTELLLDITTSADMFLKYHHSWPWTTLK